MASASLAIDNSIHNPVHNQTHTQTYAAAIVEYHTMIYIYSGNDNGTNSVAVIQNSSLSKSFINYNAINDGKINPKHIKFKQIHTSTLTCPEETIETFYNELKSINDSIHGQEI